MRFIFFIVLLTTVFTSSAQVPEKISYQAIIRDASKNLIIESEVGVKILILENTINGNSIFEEIHLVKTNTNGLITLEIGTGSQILGEFNEIPWNQGTYFVETQIDPFGGTDYSLRITNQLLSVPYALHAKSAEKLVGLDWEYAKKAKIVSFEESREILDTDVENTIECTKTATLSLISDFDLMKVGETVNLEAHDGAVLTIQAMAGVELNYTNGGVGKLQSNPKGVSFGLLRKKGGNSYIISGQ